MAARHTDYFTLRRPDDLDVLEQRIAEGDTDELTVDIPDGSNALFTAGEFRRLAGLARSSGVVIHVVTDDPLRRELALIVGLPVVMGSRSYAPPPDRREPEIAPAGETGHDEPTRQIMPPDDEEPDSTTVRVPLSPWRGLDTATASDDQIDDGSYSFVISPPLQHAPDRTDDIDASWAAWSSRGFEAVRRSPASRVRHRRRRGIALIALLLIIIAVVVAALLAPAATIALTPRVEPIETQLTYGLSGFGRSFDVVIDPTVAETTFTVTASVPTTGERFVPDGTAGGSLLLTNPSTTEVYIEAGTVASSGNGSEYVTTVDVVVPAADPYGSMTFGSVAVPIQATVAGSDGNADAESIYGQWWNGVFYTNREAISGGTMKRIATVSEADRAALDTLVRKDLDERAPATLAGLVPQGAAVIPGSENRGEATVRIDRAVGEDATVLNAEASMTLSAQVYDAESMRAEAARSVEQRMLEAAGDGRIVTSSVQVGDPVPLGLTVQDGFSITARARIERAIDSAVLDDLRAGAGGDDIADVVASAGRIAGVENVTVDRRYAWLWPDMPLLASRITIEVTGAEATVSTEATPAGR